MTDLNNEYYVLFEDNSLNLVSIDGHIKPYVHPEDPVPEDYTMKVYVALGSKRNPKFVDIHFRSCIRPIMIKAVVDVMVPLDLYKVQFIKGTYGEVLENFGKEYYRLWCYNHILSLDLEKSVYGSQEDNGTWVEDLETIVLDNEKLGRVPEEQRLMFHIKERPEFLIVHQTIVDALTPHNFVGAKFVPVKKWGIDSIFDK